VRETFEILVHDTKFWLAMIAFLNALVLWLWPDVPPNVLAAGNGLLGVIATIMAVSTTATEKRTRKLARGGQ
jgi:hypothetical protein